MVFQQHQLKSSINFTCLLWSWTFISRDIWYDGCCLVTSRWAHTLMFTTWGVNINQRSVYCSRDPVGITKTWCHGSLDWLQWRDTGSSGRTGWEDRVEQLFIWDRILAALLGDADEPAKNWWISIRVVGVWYRLLDQKDEVGIYTLHIGDRSTLTLSGPCPHRGL